MQVTRWSTSVVKVGVVEIICQGRRSKTGSGKENFMTNSYKFCEQNWRFLHFSKVTHARGSGHTNQKSFSEMIF